MMKPYLRYVVLSLVLLMVLPLMGCDEDAASLKDAMQKSLEIESSRNRTELTVINNTSTEEINEELLLLFSMLEEGVTMEIEMESLTSMAIEMQAHGEEELREQGLWPYEESLTAEIYVNGGRTAFKTAADPVYLLMDPTDMAMMAPEESPELEAVFGEDYSEQQIEMMLDFLLPFIEEFAFQFSDVENLGAAELELPDGTIEAEGFRLEMDSDEIMDLVSYSSRQLAESEHFKDYMFDSVKLPLEQLREAGTIPEEEMLSEEEMDEMAEVSYQMFRGILLDVAEITEQSPQMLREEYGLDFSATEVYYLDEDGYIRKTESAYHIRVEHEMLEEVLGTPVLDLEIQSESIVWDINEPIMVDFPAVEETVSFIGLMADPELADELGDGPLGELVELFSQMMPVPAAGSQLFMDVENGVFILNGEPLAMEVTPYMEGEVLMLPFRQMAELAGGQVSWDAENRTVYYWDDQRRQVSVTVGSDVALVNGQEVTLEGAVVIREDRTLVPAGLLEHITQHFSVQDGMAFILF